MLRLVWAQLVRRGSRSLALLLGLLVACSGFTVLTSQTRSSTLQVQQTVEANARSAYDILVRPQGTVLPQESQQGVVQAGFLAGIRGGISLQQWRSIQRIPGIEVAAPVAMVGYVVPKVMIPVMSMAPLVRHSAGRLLLRDESTWTTDNGASTETAYPSFMYVTPNRVTIATSGLHFTMTEIGADGKSRVICQQGGEARQWSVQSAPGFVTCSSRSDFLEQAGQYPQGSFLIFPLPFMVAAVDPESEARLAGLRGAMVSGSYLKPGAPGARSTKEGDVSPVVPVIVASKPTTDLSVSYRIVRLPTSAAEAVGAGESLDLQLGTRGQLVGSGTATQDEAYRLLLAAMSTPKKEGDYFARRLSYLYAVGPTSYPGSSSTVKGALAPRTVVNPRQVWALENGGDQAGSLIPAGADDTAFRRISGYAWNYGNQDQEGSPAFVKVGVFDATKLPGYSSLAAVPLGTYANTTLAGATSKDRAVLGGRPLGPSSNIAGYPASAPLMLTTLDALPAFEDEATWETLGGVTGAARIPAPVLASAPISSVRVRVAGVTGVDPVSRERVRLAAQSISALPGLTVDITTGSSPTPRTVVLPAGQLGRPQLRLVEDWVKKGAAIAILEAVDKKSLVLFLLVLVVCGLFVGNAAAASVRARRIELGVLACVGWTRAALFRLVLGELLIIGLAAGIGGAVVALAAGAGFGIPIGPARAMLAVPAALVVALAAGLVPAWAAAHAPPLEAVRPTAHLPARASAPRTVTGLAWANVTRARARSVLAAAGLAVAVAALTVIVGVAAGFRGAVVGTLLGNAVSVQVRGADYAATVAIVALAGLGVANVLFLNIRERGSELATLRALGWREPSLTRLMLLEGLALGVAGSVTGALIGLVALWVFLGGVPGAVLLTAGLALGVGLLISALATLLPSLSLRRLPTALLLTEH